MGHSMSGFRLFDAFFLKGDRVCNLAGEGLCKGGRKGQGAMLSPQSGPNAWTVDRAH